MAMKPSSNNISDSSSNDRESQLSISPRRIRRSKKIIKSKEVLLETTQRVDIVMKTILRSIRRYYINLFNSITHYNKIKRGKEP